MRAYFRHCKICGISITVNKLYCAACSDAVRINNQRRYQRNKSRIEKRDDISERRKVRSW